MCYVLPRQTTVQTPPRSRRSFLHLLTGTTGLLVAACGQLPKDPRASGKTSAALPPPGPAQAQPAPAIQVVPVEQTNPTATVPPIPTSAPPTATPVSPTATPVPPTPTAVPPSATPVPPTATAQPTPTTVVYDAARLKDKLGAAVTSYAGSISERAWNVELAAKRLHGTKVAPGELFSFNDAVGPTTLKAGFRIGYGITMSNDRPLTVPSEGGGICQVATTVFQAAYWAGLPFVERHYHLYWISRYGVAPSGKTGFDATVDDPGVDLKFRNTTGDWIRLDSWVDGANIGFTIWGVDPEWEVETIGPKIYGVVKASQAIVRQEDYSLPPGRELFVEHAEDGFSVSVTRLVKLNGDLVDQYDFTNRYLPSRNVLLVGAVPRPRVPQPVASPAEADPAASPVASPGTSPTAAPSGEPAPAPVVQPTPAASPPTAAPALPPPSHPAPPGAPKLVPVGPGTLRPTGR